MQVLIIANTRFKGGLSGGDAIYESFLKYWEGCDFKVSDMRGISYAPFVCCYLHRILLGCFRAIIDNTRYDFVYSSSDFLPDSIPAIIYKLKGRRWVAGYFLSAFKENKVHYYTQKVIKYLIKRMADMVIVTNPTMYDLFLGKKKTWINGGIHAGMGGLSDKEKEYDAVFCGRIHPSKGIDLLIKAWDYVLNFNKNARLAIIGDGDLGVEYVFKKVKEIFGHDEKSIDVLGYMGDKRFNVFKKSKVVLYPVNHHYAHFSIAPVEGMICGCPMVAIENPVMKFFVKNMGMKGVYLTGDSEYSFALQIAKIIDQKYKEKVLDAFDWATQFNYEKQANRVFNDIKKEFGYENISNG